jgi:hypothetical protein
VPDEVCAHFKDLGDYDYRPAREVAEGAPAFLSASGATPRSTDKNVGAPPDREPPMGQWQDLSLEAGEGTNRLTKPAQATRCRKNDGSTLANLPAGDTERVSLRSPVRYVVNLVMWC